MWKSITSDRCIIDTVKHGLKDELQAMPKNDYTPATLFKD